MFLCCFLLLCRILLLNEYAHNLSIFLLVDIELFLTFCYYKLSCYKLSCSVFVNTCTHILLGYVQYLGLEWLGSSVGICLALVETVTIFQSGYSGHTAIQWVYSGTS